MMKTHFVNPRFWFGQGAVLAGALVLSACGGGGGGDGAGNGTGGAAPVVSSAAAGTPKYSQKLVLTLNGSNLDQGIAVAATGCQGVVPSAASPTPNTSTTARYECRASAVGSGQFTVTRSEGGAALVTVPFSVPAPQVTMTVSNGAAVGGTIVIALAPDKAPLTVDNFLAYVNSGFYDGTVFHRVSPGFVVQGGGYAGPLDTTNQVLKPTVAPIALEVNKGLSNAQWTIAMARTSEPASATSQFFINLADNSFLDPGIGAGYAVFGSVTGGTGNVTGIASAPCVAIPFFLGAGECTPTPNVVITAAVQTQ